MAKAETSILLINLRETFIRTKVYNFGIYAKVRFQKRRETIALQSSSFVAGPVTSI